ncbi:MAG: 1-acyl-sn-glycerol-3-phosphate acyltransferase [Bacteroides sp.]|nr:1-acyl-sn-glycerol-3-phosphate acyltransferase [Bacteroides sp.]
MIYFKIVEGKPFGYYFLRKWFGWIFSYAYYKRFYVFGKKNLPAAGTPFMMVSNHQNGLLDALAILFALPLRYTVVFLARADIFKKKFIAKLLNFCKIMPVYRQRDGRETLGENAAIFDESAKLVGMGYPVTLFPEGRHQEGHYLGPVKKGFARIAFEAAERNGYPENMMIVPVGNHYSDYFAKRAKLCVRFGEPIHLSLYYGLYKENPPKAMAQLAQDVRAAIRALMLDIPDPEHYGTYDFLREAVRPEICRQEALRKRYLPHQWQADRLFAARLEAMAESADPQPDSINTRPDGEIPEASRNGFCTEKLRLLREKTEAYRKALAALNVSTQEVEKPASLPEVAGRFLLLLLGLPFALYGLCFTGLPVLLGRRKAAGIALRIKNRMLRSSFDFVLTQLLFTGAFYLVYIIAYWVIVSCMGVATAWGWACFALLLASWMLTRAFWQDYMRYACRTFGRGRGLLRKKDCRALQGLRAELCADFRA